MTDQFEADHRAGSMTPTASAAPCLFVPRDRLPAWMPSPYSYACHLTGIVPFRALDSDVLRTGQWLEPAGRMAIQQVFGLVPAAVDKRREAKHIPALCYIDDQIGDDTLVEYKSVHARNLVEHWSDGPPDYPRAQALVQATIDRRIRRVIVVPIIYGDHPGLRIEKFEFAVDPADCDMIEDTLAEFGKMLRRGELPEYDGTEPSYEAWSKKYRPAAGEVLDLSNVPEARWRAQAWYQAKIDKADVESTIAAHKHAFAKMLEEAGQAVGVIRVASVPEDIKVGRVEKAAHMVSASEYVDWRFVQRKD